MHSLSSVVVAETAVLIGNVSVLAGRADDLSSSTASHMALSNNSVWIPTPDADC